MSVWWWAGAEAAEVHWNDGDSQDKEIWLLCQSGLQGEHLSLSLPRAKFNHRINALATAYLSTISAHIPITCRTFMRSTSFWLVQRVSTWAARSAHSWWVWDLATSTFRLAKQRFVTVTNLYQRLSSDRAGVCVFSVGVYEGETEAGSTDWAGRQGAS